MNDELDLKELAGGGKICAVTGHRILPSEFDERELQRLFEGLIEEGHSLFLSGMAVGFDTACCKALFRLRKEYPVKILACIPFAGQEEKFTASQRQIYREYVEMCDEKVILYSRYTTGCYFGRNRYMVDGCDSLVAYLRTNAGGTYYTVNYAQQKEKKIIYV